MSEAVWHSEMRDAPRDATELRVRVRSPQGKLRELPWLLVWLDGWRYATTWAPVHSWHRPVWWSVTERTPEAAAFFADELRRVYGSTILPSEGNPRPILRLKLIEGGASAPASSD